MIARSGLRLAAALAVVAGVAALPATSHASSSSSVTKSWTVERTNLDAGTSTVVDKRTVSLSVDQTTNLHGRQELTVSWKGAHPTGGLVADQNASGAANEEYPFVLLECRGVDSAKASASKRLSPETCWTQASSERYQQSFSYGVWRTDRYASAHDRAAEVGAPAPRPAACLSPPPSEYFLPMIAASGKKYYGGAVGCAGLAPESSDAGGVLSLPSNETFGVTQPDGTGSARFDVFTAAENATLGCSADVPCSLVAVPVMGLSCDAAGTLIPAAERPFPGQVDDATKACEAKGYFAPGESSSGGGHEDVSVSGQLWWSASNWRNRTSIPLTFAPAANVCDIVGTGAVVDVYGSELLSQATTQWAPSFCLDRKLFRFKHVYTGEPAARNLLSSGSADAAFVSDVPSTGWSRPTVAAPVATTGFAITYTVDDAQGREYKKLKLDPRLLAKLLTESYPSELPVQQSYKALSKNPLDITADPEFQALNPDAPRDINSTEAASTLLALSDQSDVTQALTSYIQADPEARAWLDGAPDQWGMRVNPNYKHIALPVDNWPLLDTFEPKNWYRTNAEYNNCLFQTPTPYLPLVAAPLPTLASIAESMQFSLANSQTVCQQLGDGITDGEKLVAQGRQTVGRRFMIGLTSLADARRYQLDTAALQTHVATPQGTHFTAAGRTFVQPSDATLRAAAKLLVPDGSSDTWNLPYSTLRTSAGKNAYPGTMVVYMATPTEGLPKSEAVHYAQLLRFAAGTGQQPGEGNGQLPSGYLPMTKADGLGALVDYTQRAADAVAAQQGTVPPLVPVASTPTTGPTGTGGSTGGPGSSGAAASTPSPSASVPAIAFGTAPTQILAVGVTRSPAGGLIGALLPVLLLVALAAGVLAPLTRTLARRRKAAP